MLRAPFIHVEHINDTLVNCHYSLDAVPSDQSHERPLATPKSAFQYHQGPSSSIESDTHSTAASEGTPMHTDWLSERTALHETLSSTPRL